MYGLIAQSVKYVDLICDPMDMIVILGPCKPLPCCLVFAISQSSSPSISIRFHQPRPRKLKSILSRIQIQKWIGNKAKIRVEWVDSCRDWSGWPLVCEVELLNNLHQITSPLAHQKMNQLPLQKRSFFSTLGFQIPARFQRRLPVTFRGGMKVDHSGHHAFLFMRRAGLVAS